MAEDTHRSVRIERTAVGEMRLMCLRPAAEQLVVDGDQLDLGEALDVLRIGKLGLRRPVVVLCGDLLGGIRTGAHFAQPVCPGFHAA